MNKSEQWTDEYLDKARLRGDELADTTIQNMFAKGEVKQFNEMMRHMHFNDQTMVTGMNASIVPYLMQASVLPEWFEPERYERARIIFEKYEIQIMAILLFAALPASYAAAKGAHVLVNTYRLTHNAHRRSLETVQLIRDVMGERGIYAGGKGMLSLQKVRLLHAATRYLLQKQEWDVDYYGVPINQEDMAGTNILFSYLIIKKLPLMGVFLTPDEIKDYMHVWCVFGYLMGIDEALLTDDYAEAEALAIKIRQRHFVASEDGEYLVKALVDMVKENTDEAFTPIIHALIRFLGDDEVADSIGIPKQIWFEFLLPFKWANSFFKNTPQITSLAVKAAEILFGDIYKEQVTTKIEIDRADFSVPERFTKSWKKGELKQYTQKKD